MRCYINKLHVSCKSKLLNSTAPPSLSPPLKHSFYIIVFSAPLNVKYTQWHFNYLLCFFFKIYFIISEKILQNNTTVWKNCHSPKESRKVNRDTKKILERKFAPFNVSDSVVICNKCSHICYKKDFECIFNPRSCLKFSSNSLWKEVHLWWH